MEEGKNYPLDATHLPVIFCGRLMVKFLFPDGVKGGPIWTGPGMDFENKPAWYRVWRLADWWKLTFEGNEFQTFNGKVEVKHASGYYQLVHPSEVFISRKIVRK